MYNNVGSKIKTLAIVLCVIEMLFSLIVGAVFMLVGTSENSDGGLTIWGIVVIFVGFLFSWFNNILLYGFGELIERTAETAENTRIILSVLKPLTEEVYDPFAANDENIKIGYCQECCSSHVEVFQTEYVHENRRYKGFLCKECFYSYNPSLRPEEEQKQDN